MAKIDGSALLIIGGLVLVAMMVMNQPAQTTTTTTSGGSGVDLCKVVQPSASFTAVTMFKQGTALGAAEGVRVIKKNGGDLEKDLGTKSIISGTLSTAPAGSYKLYWGENSSTYYTHKEDYTAPCQDAVDDKTAELCTIDTAPTITAFNEYGQPQSGGANNVSIGTGEEKETTIEIKTAADKCYGNPDAPSGNVVCFEYNTGNYTKVEVVGGTKISAPYILSNALTVGRTQACYEFDKLQDIGKTIIPIKIEAKDSFDPLGTGDEAGIITVSTNDIAFDLDADSLEEIWGFEDEDNNELGASAATTGYIYVS